MEKSNRGDVRNRSKKGDLFWWLIVYGVGLALVNYTGSVQEIIGMIFVTLGAFFGAVILSELDSIRKNEKIRK